jgi:hypothetical protein
VRNRKCDQCNRRSEGHGGGGGKRRGIIPEEGGRERTRGEEEAQTSNVETDTEYVDLSFKFCAVTACVCVLSRR